MLHPFIRVRIRKNARTISFFIQNNLTRRNTDNIVIDDDCLIWYFEWI
jgi:hypothetical protein